MARSRHDPRRIAVAAIALLGLAAGQSARADPLSHTGLPSVLHDVSTNAGSAAPDVTVTTPSPPAAQQVAGDSLYQFIVHHATTHYVTTATTHNLARWRGGRQSICPLTGGLQPSDDALVTARVRALAAYVGAPVQANPCEVNVQILFTSNPREAMEAVMQWATATSTFGLRYSGGMRDLVAYKGGHAIQGWYLTTRGGARVLNTDVTLVGLDVLPLWPEIEQKYLGTGAIGTRVGGGSGSGIGIGTVILIVDTTKVAGYKLATLADYLAMLTMTVVQTPDHCDALPSILDLMSSGCRAGEMPGAMTAADLAFLKALYYRNTGLGPSLSRAAIQDNMARQFQLR